VPLPDFSGRFGSAWGGALLIASPSVLAGVKLIRTEPRDIRLGDLVGGRRVKSLERTSYGVLVGRVGRARHELFTDDHVVEVMRPDRVAMQALVQASASL
jgi:hypothetical protein